MREGRIPPLHGEQAGDHLQGVLDAMVQLTGQTLLFCERSFQIMRPVIDLVGHHVEGQTEDVDLRRRFFERPDTRTRFTGTISAESHVNMPQIAEQEPLDTETQNNEDDGEQNEWRQKSLGDAEPGFE